MSELEVGRLDPKEVGESQSLDTPSKAVSALVSKNDEIIDLIKALMAKLDSDGGVTQTDYAASLSDSLQKLKFRL